MNKVHSYNIPIVHNYVYCMYNVGVHTVVVTGLLNTDSS